MIRKDFSEILGELTKAYNDNRPEALFEVYWQSWRLEECEEIKQACYEIMRQFPPSYKQRTVPNLREFARILAPRKQKAKLNEIYAVYPEIPFEVKKSNGTMLNLMYAAHRDRNGEDFVLRYTKHFINWWRKREKINKRSAGKDWPYHQNTLYEVLETIDWPLYENVKKQLEGNGGKN